MLVVIVDCGEFLCCACSDPRPPIKRPNKIPGNLNFFGTPKSKEDLDDELDKVSQQVQEK